MDHVLGTMSEKSGCEMSFGTVRITDLHLADDAVIFAETTEVLAGALDWLSEEAGPFGLQVSWIKTKVQAGFTVYHFYQIEIKLVGWNYTSISTIARSEMEDKLGGLQLLLYTFSANSVVSTCAFHVFQKILISNTIVHKIGMKAIIANMYVKCFR